VIKPSGKNKTRNWYQFIISMVLSNPVKALFLISFFSELAIIVIFPAVFGGDTLARLLHRERFLLVHWLPATQFIVYWSMIIFGTIITVRICFATIGSFLIVGFYKFIRVFYNTKQALLGSLIFAFTPMVLTIATVPYQETLFLCLIIYSLIFFRDKQTLLSALAFGLACLTRYEAWVFSPFWVYLIFIDENNKLNFEKSHIKIGRLILYTWGILVWFFINYYEFGDLLNFNKRYGFTDNISSNENTYLKSLAINFIWVVKFGGLLSFFSIIGIWEKGKIFLKESKELKALFIWVLVLIFVLPTFIPGYSGSSRFIITSLVILAVFIPAGLQYTFKQSRWRIHIYYVSITYLLVHSVLYMYRISTKEALKNSFEITRFIDDNISQANRAIMIAEGFEMYPDVD